MWNHIYNSLAVLAPGSLRCRSLPLLGAASTLICPANWAASSQRFVVTAAAPRSVFAFWPPFNWACRSIYNLQCKIKGGSSV